MSRVQIYGSGIPKVGVLSEPSRRRAWRFFVIFMSFVMKAFAFGMHRKPGRLISCSMRSAPL